MNSDNSAQIAYWSGGGGERWAGSIGRLDLEMRAIGLLAMDALAPAEGSTVLEVGPGTGAATVELARRVGPSGQIIGVDVSIPLMEIARKNVADHGFNNVRIMHADAQQVTLDAPVDAVFSRLGVMFFSDSTAAFANLRRNTKPGGRIGFVSWQSLANNPWFGAASNALNAAVGLPSPQPDPDAPGVFALADPDRVRRYLEDAGWKNVDVRPLVYELTLDLEQADVRLASALHWAPAEFKAAPEDVQEKATQQAREAILAFERGGALRFPQAVLVVTGEA
jgi:SAM-dependent methyltransferase